MNKIRIIGVGSPFEYDRLGWSVVDRLRGDAQLQSDFGNSLDIVKLDRPATALLDQLQSSQNAIIIDALKGAYKLNQVMVLSLEDLQEACGLNSTHGWGVAEVLRLGGVLNALPARLVILGAEVKGGQKEFDLMVSAICANIKRRLAREHFAAM